MLCTIFEMFIVQLNYELVGIAQTGMEALEICEVNPPDVILMDIHLAGQMNGIETAKIISERFDIPVIFVTSDIEEKTIHAATYTNTYGFLMKPIYKSSLGVTIEFAYSKHKFDRENKR